MTTIVADFRAKIIGADSRTEWDGIWWKSDKLCVLPDCIVGMAGTSHEIRTVIEWYQAGRPKKKPKVSSFCGLVLRRSGLYALANDFSETRVDQEFLAIGSGGNAATAVLMHGGTVLEALEIAAQIDTDTAGPFKILDLESALANPPA